jgi:phosphoglycolate phosphatase
MALRAILFDLDGTLVDSAGAITSALNSLRVDRGASPVNIDRVRPLISLGAEDLVRQGLGEVAQNLETDLKSFRQRLAGIDSHTSDIYPGVTELLDGLRNAGAALAVVTNKPEGLSRKLLHDLNLSQHFGAIVGGDTAPWPKPHPAPLLAALAILACSAEEAAFVGDSMVDAKAAAALSLPFYFFMGGYSGGNCTPTNVVQHFSYHLDLLNIFSTQIMTS